MHDLSLEAAQKLFFWSNVLYLVGALLTFGCAALVLFAKRTPFPRIGSQLLNERVVLVPAAVCVLGTVSAICFSSFVLNRERASLAGSQMQVALELSRLRYSAEADRVAARQLPDPETASEPLTNAGSAPTAVGGTGRALDLGPGAGDSLKVFEGMRAVVESAPGDTEASEFADRLLLLLIAQGIDARQGADQSVLHAMAGQPGIHLRYRDPDRAHDLAAALAALLRGRGLHVDVAPAWDLVARLDTSAGRNAMGPLKRDQVLISVGPKPNNND